MIGISYSRFNQVCILLSAFFILGTFWQWRGVEFPQLQAETSEPAQSYASLLEKDDLTPVSFSNNNVDDTEFLEQKKDPSAAPQDDEGARGGSVSDLKQLPEKINLAVPFTSQAPEKNWDQPWQDACEEAAVLMLDAYYKGYGLSPLFAKDEILRMVAWEEELGWGGSIDITRVSSLATKVTGKPAPRIIENPTVDDIKELLAAGHPVLVVADGKVLPNPYFSGDGPVYHALVIRGYTETTFITNDPGTQFGENFEYPYDDLMNALRDWNGGDVKNGTPVVMVLE